MLPMRCRAGPTRPAPHVLAVVLGWAAVGAYRRAGSRVCRLDRHAHLLPAEPGEDRQLQLLHTGGLIRWRRDQWWSLRGAPHEGHRPDLTRRGARWLYLWQRRYSLALPMTPGDRERHAPWTHPGPLPCPHPGPHSHCRD